MSSAVLLVALPFLLSLLMRLSSSSRRRFRAIYGPVFSPPPSLDLKHTLAWGWKMSTYDSDRSALLQLVCGARN